MFVMIMSIDKQLSADARLFTAQGRGLFIDNPPDIASSVREANADDLKAINDDAALYQAAAWAEEPDGRIIHVPIASLRFGDCD